MPDLVFRISVFKWFLMAGPLIGLTCALLSPYVVLRRMSLLSEGISHAGFGGIALALLVGYYMPALEGFLPQRLITGVFCVMTAVLIGYVARRKRVTEDSAIGIFLVATLALGDLLLNIRVHLPSQPGRLNFVPNPENLLFGDIVSASSTDVLLLSITCVLIFAVIVAIYYQLLYTTLDEEMARVNGVNTRLINLLLLIMISTVIVICVRLVGALMITALTIIPGATANMISRRFIGVMVGSLFIGTLGTSAATWLAIFPPFDKFTPGPLVVLTLFLIFAVVWIYRHNIKPRPQNLDATTPQAPEHAGHSH